MDRRHNNLLIDPFAQSFENCVLENLGERIADSPHLSTRGTGGRGRHSKTHSTELAPFGEPSRRRFFLAQS